MSSEPIVIVRRRQVEDEHMFVSRRYHRSSLPGLLLLLLAALALLALGCGGGDDPEGDDDATVITAWADTLARGDVAGAAEFFALPSVAENGPIAVQIETTEDAIAFNESLPCGAEVVSTEAAEDGFTIATFTLTERPGGNCGAGVGGTASTAFLIEGGKILEWRRVPREEGNDPALPGPEQEAV